MWPSDKATLMTNNVCSRELAREGREQGGGGRGRGGGGVGHTGCHAHSRPTMRVCELQVMKLGHDRAYDISSARH